MSAFTSFSPPPVQLPGSSEHLSVQTLIDPAYSRHSVASATSIDEVQFGLDAQPDDESMGENHSERNFHPDFEGIADIHSTSELDPHQGQLTPQEVLDALDEAVKQAEAAAASVSSPTMSTAEPTKHTEQHTSAEVSTSVTRTAPVFEPDHIEYPATNEATSQDFVSYEESEEIDTDTQDPAHFDSMLNERDIPMLAQDLAREVEAEMDTDPSVGQSVEAEAEQEQTDLGAEPPQPATSSDLGANQPAPEVETTLVEPLRRMDDETIPVTAHSKDSVIGIFDATPSAAAAEIQLTGPDEQEAGPSDAAAVEGEPSTEDEIMPFEEDEKTPEDEIVPSDGPEEQPQVNTMVYLEHIQMVDPDQDVQENGTAEDDLAIDVGALDGEDAPAAEGELVPEQVDEPTPTVEAEPAALVDTQSTVEDDAALALEDDTYTESHTATTIETTVEPAAQPEDTQPESETAPETVVTTTTTTTTTIVTELDPVEQPTSATDADGEAEIDEVEEAEYMKRAEQTRLEQGGDAEASGAVDKDATPIEEELPLGEVVAGDPSVVTDPTAPKDSEMVLDAQAEEARDVTAEPGPSAEVAASAEPVNPPEPDQALSPRIPQYAIALAAPSVVAPPGLFDQPASIDWEGFAALDEDAPGSPEFVDQSSEVGESPEEPTAAPSASTSGEAASAGPSKSASVPAKSTTPRARKPKMIMEVVIPLPGKPKPATDQEPAQTSRGRSKAKATAPSRAGGPSASKARSRSSSRTDEPSPARSTGSSTASATPRKNASTSSARVPSASGSARKRGARRRPFGSRKKVIKKSGQRHPQVDHVARAFKVEVVMAKRPSVLRRMGSIPSGNSVKFAPSVSPAAGKKRKAEEQDVGLEADDPTEDEDADAEGEYEDVEDEPEPEPEHQPKANKSPSKPVKRARRSLSARKKPSKLPEVLTDTPRPKKRRIRR